MIQLSKRHGIETGTFIMLGYPGRDVPRISRRRSSTRRPPIPSSSRSRCRTPSRARRQRRRRDPDRPGGPWETTTDRDTKLRHPHSSLYYWFATTRVVSEVGYHKATRQAVPPDGAGRKPRRGAVGAGSLGAARLRVKAMVGRAGMRFDPTLRKLEDRAQRWVGQP